MELTKDMYDPSKIEVLLKAAKLIIGNQGDCCAFVDAFGCDECPLFIDLLASDTMGCGAGTIDTIGTPAAKNKSLDLAKQFVDLYDKPKTLHIDIMG